MLGDKNGFHGLAAQPVELIRWQAWWNDSWQSLGEMYNGFTVAKRPTRSIRRKDKPSKRFVFLKSNFQQEGPEKVLTVSLAPWTARKRIMPPDRTDERELTQSAASFGGFHPHSPVSIRPRHVLSGRCTRLRCHYRLRRSGRAHRAQSYTGISLASREESKRKPYQRKSRLPPTRRTMTLNPGVRQTQAAHRSRLPEIQLQCLNLQSLLRLFNNKGATPISIQHTAQSTLKVVTPESGPDLRMESMVRGL